MLDEFAELNEPIARLKVVLVGEANVGKSSIVNRYWRDTFYESYNFTIGIDFHSKLIQTQKRTVEMQLWDTAGQERFRALLPSYLRNCSVVIIAYDITNKKSFESLTFWIGYVKQQTRFEIKIIVVGTKSDLDAKREVKQSIAERYCLQSGLQFFEVSSKTGQNLSQLFECAANCSNSTPKNSIAVVIEPASKRTPESRKTCTSC